MKVEKVRIDDIIINPDRQRKTFDEQYIDDLSESMRLVGLIHPIVIDDNDNILISGECRIRAARQLGWSEIDASLKSNLSAWEREIIELEENIRRKALTPAEELKAKSTLDKLYREKYGSAEFGSNKGGWGIKDTAQLLGISLGAASEDLQLARAIENNPEMGKLRTKVAIRSEFKRQQAIKSRQLLVLLKERKDKDDGVQTTTDRLNSKESLVNNNIYIINITAAQGIGRLLDESIHCLITDPPWQVMHDEIAGSDPNTGLELTEQVLRLLKPKLITGAHCWMFCAMKHLIKGTIYNLLLDCGYNVFEQVLLWTKPTVAHSSHPYREIKGDYEPAVFFSKGEARDLLKPIFSVQEARIVGHRIHPEQKPVSVLKTIIETSTIEGETVIDPFCGSGQVGVACKELKRKVILFEKQKHWYDVALTELGLV